MGQAPALASGGGTLSLEQRLKAQAYAAGFDLCGITRLGTPSSFGHFEEWLSLGRAGEMAYMSQYRAQRADTRLVHPGAVSAIVVAMNYGGRAPSGPVARYARGDDYHDVMRQRLRTLLAWLESEVGHALDARPFADTAPILERDLARQAGLGWIGKNTNLIHPRHGSYLFLGSLFVNLELVSDEPFTADRCGSCRRCIDACPTDAIVAPHELDAALCVSYLTIELRGAIPLALRPQMGELVYGCDVCQEVCPFTAKFDRPHIDAAFATRSHLARAALTDWVVMSADAWREFSRGSAITRTKRRGFLRNVAVALGNRGDPVAIPSLAVALTDEEPLVRSHAAWALGRIGTPAAVTALRERLEAEADRVVVVEILQALDAALPGNTSHPSG